MVSAAKLRKAERIVINFRPYQQRLNEILRNYLSTAHEINSVFTRIRDVHRVAIVVFASNSALCGNYNNILIKRMQQSIKTHRDVRKEDIIIFPIGKKVHQACTKLGIKVAGNFDKLAEKPDFDNAEKLAVQLMDMFVNNEIDRVKVIYFHYINKAVQKLTVDTFLPFEISYYGKGQIKADYLIEPSKEIVISRLIPLVQNLRIYATMLDAYTSENAARTMAMQIADDNANELLEELSLEYNKQRQQAITSELLDIMGGTFR